MDDLDKGRGLFSYFRDGSEREQEQPDAEPPRAAEPTPSKSADQCVDCAASDESPGYLQRQLSMALRQILTNPLGVRQVTRNPVTGEYNYLPYVKSVGERYSQSMPLPDGVAPTGMNPTGPAITLPRPGFMFGPGAGAISQPQAEDVGPLVFSRSFGRMSKQACDKQEAEEMALCGRDYGEVYGYNTWPFHACKQRTQDRAILCRKGRTDGPPPWSAADMESSYIPKNLEL